MKEKLFFSKIVILLTFSAFAAAVFCQNKDGEMIRFVVQPELEIGKSNDFLIYFDEIPDKNSLKMQKIKGLELTDETNTIEDKIQKTGDDFSRYSFHTYVTPTRLGRIDFPILTMKIKGKEYRTKPFSVNVVGAVNVGTDAVKLVWETNKTSYKLNDQIKITLYEYSKFSNASRKTVPGKTAIRGKDNTINVSSEMELNDFVGIDGFKEFIDKNFKETGFEWNPFNKNKTMDRIGNENYIKTMIFSIDLLPKSKGTFKIDRSEFDYNIYKSNTDYFNRFVAAGDKSYKVTDNNAVKINAKSQPLVIEVK